MANTWIENLPGPALEKWVKEKGDEAKERYGVEDVYFALWLHYVNKHVMRRAHVSFMDLEDWDYASAYESDVTPRDAAVEMLQDNGWGAVLQD